MGWLSDLFSNPFVNPASIFVPDARENWSNQLNNIDALNSGIGSIVKPILSVGTEPIVAESQGAFLSGINDLFKGRSVQDSAMRGHGYDRAIGDEIQAVRNISPGMNNFVEGASPAFPVFGAAIGSIFPGVGTAVGGAVGKLAQNQAQAPKKYYETRYSDPDNEFNEGQIKSSLISAAIAAATYGVGAGVDYASGALGGAADYAANQALVDSIRSGGEAATPISAAEFDALYGNGTFTPSFDSSTGLYTGGDYATSPVSDVIEYGANARSITPQEAEYIKTGPDYYEYVNNPENAPSSLQTTGEENVTSDSWENYKIPESNSNSNDFYNKLTTESYEKELGIPAQNKELPEDYLLKMDSEGMMDKVTQHVSDNWPEYLKLAAKLYNKWTQDQNNGGVTFNYVRTGGGGKGFNPFPIDENTKNKATELSNQDAAKVSGLSYNELNEKLALSDYYKKLQLDNITV